MPGFVIHLAIGEQYVRKRKINNKNQFLKGIISPDLLDKEKSHYIDKSGNPDFKAFLQANSLENDYNKGYLLHLISDYLFYNKFLDEFTEEIYSDYNKLNFFLIEKYQITISPEIQQFVGFQNGTPTILSLDKICKFINALSDFDIDKIGNLKTYLQSFDIKKEETDVNR